MDVLRLPSGSAGRARQLRLSPSPHPEAPVAEYLQLGPGRPAACDPLDPSKPRAEAEDVRAPQRSCAPMSDREHAILIPHTVWNQIAGGTGPYQVRIGATQAFPSSEPCQVLYRVHWNRGRRFATSWDKLAPPRQLERVGTLRQAQNGVNERFAF